jgi:glycosyltransferase involved in cell wall biosynthesis
VFHSMGAAASLYTLLSPYFLSYALSMRDRRFSDMCLKRLRKRQTFTHNKRYKVALFTDTFYEINGVAKTLQSQIQVARKTEIPMMLITCSMEPTIPPVINFMPVGTYQLPEYPEMKLYYPPILKMLDYCYEQNFTHIHAETPGPLGLTALAIAHIMKIPVYGTYHTSLPQVARILTGDPSVEEYIWKYVLWYYGHMDRVFVPSRATGEELESRGIAGNKIKIIQRGIDIDFFHPCKRNGWMNQRYSLKPKDLKLLYVGRVSKDKNLDLLVSTFRKIAAIRKNISLIVVGYGPYLPDIKKELQ